MDWTLGVGVTGAAGSYSLVDDDGAKPTRFPVAENPSNEWRLSAVLKDFREPDVRTDEERDAPDETECAAWEPGSREAVVDDVTAGVQGGRKAF